MSNQSEYDRAHEASDDATSTALDAYVAACPPAYGTPYVPALRAALTAAFAERETKAVPVVWTPEQVANLNAFQSSGWCHPFTCANRGDGKHANDGELVATVRGWICPWCDYTQNWAHDFMLEKHEAPFTPPPTPQQADDPWFEGAFAADKERGPTLPTPPQQAASEDERWEPGGDLGNDEAFIRRSTPERTAAVNAALGLPPRSADTVVVTDELLEELANDVICADDGADCKPRMRRTLESFAATLRTGIDGNKP